MADVAGPVDRGSAWKFLVQSKFTTYEIGTTFPRSQNVPRNSLCSPGNILAPGTDMAIPRTVRSLSNEGRKLKAEEVSGCCGFPGLLGLTHVLAHALSRCGLGTLAHTGGLFCT